MLRKASLALCLWAGVLPAALKIDPKADIHPTAVLIGNITVGPYTRIGPKVVIQGDVAIGHHVNIQGQAVIHAGRLTIGNYVKIGYGSRVVGGRPAVPGITANTVPDETYIRDDCWVGMNRPLRGARLAPGAVAMHDTVVPANALDEDARIYAGAYVEGNVHFGREVRAQVGVMIVSDKLAIGDHTHIYDQAMIVDGRPRDTPRVGLFSWINHMAALEGAEMGDFALSNIGVAAAAGTRIGRAALLLNGAATYAGQELPPRSISYGIPARVRVADSTMQERMLFFYGRDWPTWERQAPAADLKNHDSPQ